MLGNPVGRRIGWPILRQRWTEVQQDLGPFAGTASIVAALGAFCSRAALAEMRAFFNRHPVPEAERTLQQTFEQVEACAALSERQTPVLRQWLAAAAL